MENLEKNFISLAEATKFCKYSQPYLNLRIRQGKLKAVKFGRNWMTTKEWLEDYLKKIESQKKNYISLAEATGFCSYSLPYLNLRIRQGKLRAVKLGRNWMTTKEWLEDYLKKIEQYEKATGKISFRKLKTEFHSGPSDLAAIGGAKIKSFVFPQKIIAVIAIIGIVSSIFCGAIIFNNKHMLSTGLVKNLSAQTLQFVETTFSNYFSFLIDKASKFAEGVFKWPKYFSLAPPIKDQGSVVVPSTSEDGNLKIKIQNSFSDEVKVEPVDDTSGYITPVFDDKNGDKYLYMMVPIDKK